MKTLWGVMLVAASVASADNLVTYHGPVLDRPLNFYEQSAIKLEDQRKWFNPSDPWRYFTETGETISAKNTNFVQFVGQVLEVHKDKGIRVQGYFGKPCMWPGGTAAFTTPQNNIPIPDQIEFFVEGFPYAVFEGDFITWEQSRVAVPSGAYSYSTVGGTSRMLRKLQYGIPTTEPPARPLTAEEKAALQKKRTEQASRTLEWHKKLASEGDAYGLVRMAERYMTGNGVETNKAKAKVYLQRAADDGSAEAKQMLEKLN